MKLLFKYSLILFLTFLSISALVAREKKSGKLAVKEFYGNCFSGKDSIDKLARTFSNNGWQKNSKADKRIVHKILKISKRALKREDRIEVFEKGIKSKRMVAIISRAKTVPAIGCYVYAPFRDFKSAESMIKTILKTDPLKLKISVDSFRS